MNKHSLLKTAVLLLIVVIMNDLIGLPFAVDRASAVSTADVPANLSAEGITKLGWESIQAQISAAQYYFTRYETAYSMGYRAPNPAMDLGILISDTGMTFQSQEELTLSLFSWDGTEISGSMLHENADEVRRQSSGLTETIINQPDGIGYQVLIESQAQGSQASLHYNTSGEMQAAASGDDLIILDSKGAPAIRISGLSVVDAAGNVLTSNFTADNQQMDIWISNLENAVYPLNIMMRLHTENNTLIHLDPSNYDYFGYSVGISGDVLVVGAYGQDDGGDMSGAAYVFHRMQGGSDNWGQVQKLTASDASAGDYFGCSVGVSEDVIAVGAYGDDDGGSDSGAAYVFQRMKGGGDQWGQVEKLTASDPEANDYLGKSVAVDGDIVVAGAEGEDTGGLSAGAVYIFHRYEGGVDFWDQLQKITAPDAEAGDSFGNSVAIYGGNIVVGARNESSGGSGAGAAYVFHRDSVYGSGSWEKFYKLTASDAQTNDNFGVSVAISGDVIVIGANQEDSAGTDAGAAYVFHRCGDGVGHWGEVKKLVASDAGNEDNFGVAVAVAGDLITVGANLEDELGENAGAAYVYHRKDGGADAWGQVQKLTGSTTGAGDNFGFAVAMSEDTILVGADKYSTNGTEAGGAYLFQDEIKNWLEFSEVDDDDGAGGDNFGYAAAVSGDVLVVGAIGKDEPGYADLGAVYIFLRMAGGADNWGFVRKLQPSGVDDGQKFGYSVALCGDKLAVGMPNDDYKDVDAGAVMIYQRDLNDITSWSYVTTVYASDGQQDDNFGMSVALSDDVLVVGAPYESFGSIESGAVYIYQQRNGGSNSWGQTLKLKAPDHEAYDNFGWSVGVWGDVVAVGAPRSNDGSSADTGSVYVFHRMNGGADTWGQMQKLTAADAEGGDLLGSSVSVWGDVIVAGASHSDSGAVDSGAAYIFQRMQDGTDTWGQVQKLIASDAEETDHFGSSVSVWGDTAVIGAPAEDSLGADAGAAYVFQRTQGGADQWGEVQKLLPSSISDGDSFGSSTAISGDVVVVGAHLDDTNGENAGLAVIFNTAENSDMTIDKTAEPSPVLVNGILTYTLSVENLGPDEAENVSVTDTLPTGVSFQSASGTGWACSEAGGVVTCTRDSLAVGAAPDITIVVAVPGSTGTLQNTATVSISNYDGVSSNNEVQIETRIVEEADLAIDKTASSDTVLTEDTLTYTLSVVNLGPNTAEDVTVTDTLPSGVIYQSASGTGWDCTETGGVVTCTRSSLAVEIAPDITILVTAPSVAGVIQNTASVSTNSFDGVSTNNEDTCLVTVDSRFIYFYIPLLIY